MAKKKSSKKKTSAPKEFTSSPFKDLKGLSASKGQPVLLKNTEDQVNKVSSETAAQTNSGDSFADEMNFLGVKPLQGRTIEASETEKIKAEERHVLSHDSREKRDKETFLDALGAMETTFVDEWSEDEPVRKATPRRMKQLERGTLRPEAELDLHGLTVDEARAKVIFFLQNTLYQGCQTVLVITGKGYHSSNGPVLRTAIENLLETQRELVLEWGLAPQRYGGRGALVVFLRQPETCSFS